MDMKKIIFFIVVSFWIVLISGCDSEKGYVRVDLTKKTKLPQEQLPDQQQKVLRVAVAAMISPKETYAFYEKILVHLGKEIGYKIYFIQRKTYSEINELFPRKLIDLAFICSGPYAVQKEQYGFHGIATPVVRGEPYYQSYLIVSKDSEYQRFWDLRGKVFAFTDPDSNTGALVPRYWLFLKGQTEYSFFSQIIFTYSHDNSIIAVANKLVDGATVDGHKWEYFNREQPELTSKTKVIRKSEPFGGPPLVASFALADELKHQIQDVILRLHENDNGREILDKLMIDRFAKPRDGWYEKIKIMHHDMQSKKK